MCWCSYEPHWYHSCDTRPLRNNCFIYCHGRWKKDLCMTSRTCLIILIQALPPNTFSEMRVVALICTYSLNAITDLAGQSKNGWRGNVLHHLLTSQLPSPGFHHHILQWFTQVMPSKGTITIWKAGEWNEELESNVWSECPPQNSAKSRNSAHKFVCSWFSDCTALDFTVLGGAAAVQSQRRIGKQQRQTKPDFLC